LDYLSVNEVIRFREVSKGTVNLVNAYQHQMLKRQLKSSATFRSQQEFDRFFSVAKFKPFESVSFEYEISFKENQDSLNEFLRICGEKITSLEVIEFHVLASQLEADFYEHLPNLRSFKVRNLSFWSDPLEAFYDGRMFSTYPSPGFITLFPKPLTNLTSFQFSKTCHPALPFLFFAKSKDVRPNTSFRHTGTCFWERTR